MTIRSETIDIDPVLNIEDLSVQFRTEDGTISAVDRVNMRLNPGEIVGVVGESGCGKSVTAMSVAGLLPSAARISGSARLINTELIGAKEAVLRGIRGRDIAYIFQEPMTSLNPVLTVGRQIGEVVQVHEGFSRAKARAKAIELMTLVGIPSAGERVDTYPHQMSGGMRQRVVIAMAVACGPKVLIADEPTTALDVTVQAGILNVLRDLRRELGTAVLIITHDLGVIADIADRVVVMYAGRIVESASVQDLFEHPRHHYTAGLLRARPRSGLHAGSDRLQEIPGLVPVLSVPPDACTFADRCRSADAQCRSVAPPLVGHGVDPQNGSHLAACWHPNTSGRGSEPEDQR